jgi:hypothetical protein
MPKDAGSGGVTGITGSNVNTAGGDIVGRDKIQHVSSHQLEYVLGPKRKTCRRFGRRQINGGTVGLVAGIVSAFASPLLSGLAGPATKYVLDKIQGK